MAKKMETLSILLIGESVFSEMNLSHMFEGDHVFAVAPKFMLIDGSNHSTSRLCVDPAHQILYGN